MSQLSSMSRVRIPDDITEISTSPYTSTSGPSTASRGVVLGTGKVITEASKVKVQEPPSSKIEDMDSEIIPIETIANKDILVVPEGKVKVTKEKLETAFNKTIQDGFESYKTLQTRVPVTPMSNGDYIMPKVKELTTTKIKIDYETINKNKQSYRSGLRGPADVGQMSGREKLELKEINIPKLIKPYEYGGSITYSNANGLNGSERLKLMNNFVVSDFQSF